MPCQGENEGEKPSRAADSLWQGPLWNLARQGNKKAYAQGASVNSAQLTRSVISICERLISIILMDWTWAVFGSRRLYIELENPGFCGLLGKIFWSESRDRAGEGLGRWGLGGQRRCRGTF